MALAAEETTLSTSSTICGIALEDDGKTIAVGSVDPMDCDFVPKIVIGNAGLLDFQKDETNPKAGRIVPKKKGTTDVAVYDEKGKLIRKFKYNIIANELSQKVLSLRHLLEGIEGITIESVEEKIVIDGELIVPRDFDRILQVSAAYPEVLNLVTLSKISREALAKRMQKEINDDPGGVNVQVNIKNDTFFLLGKVDSSADKERAETIATTYLPEVINSQAIKEGVITPGTKQKFSIRNLIFVEEAPPNPAPKMIRITYHFMEIGKEFLKNSFFKWVPLMQEGAGLQIGQSTTGGTAATSAGSFTATITNLIPKIQSGANGGFARVLFSTVMLGEENTPIEVVRSDQVPYISAVVNGVPVQENVQVGISIKVTPTVLGDEKMRLNTNFSFSALAGAGAGGKPRVTTNQVVNQIIVKSGESAALGGLVHNDTAKDIDKDPETGAPPAGSALFTLLRSKAFRNKKTQFVVFITPKIIADAAEGTADIKTKILNNNKKRKRVIK